MPQGDPDPVAASVAAYTDHASAYEATHAPKMGDRVERFARQLPVPSLILDAGCGPGRDLARFTGLGHVARGVDLNPAFAARARAYAPCYIADLRELDRVFPSGLFDGIWSSASLVHLNERQARLVLGHFADLLRPGGRLYVCVGTVGSTGWLIEDDGRRWYQIWDPEVFVGTVGAAGFDIDEVVEGAFVEVWARRPA